jgi:hypothetical protein
MPLQQAQSREAQAFYVATPLGFEPRITPPKGAVLPLHHGVCAFGILDRRFSIQAQCPKLKPDCACAEQLGAAIKVESTGGATSMMGCVAATGFVYGTHKIPPTLSDPS